MNLNEVILHAIDDIVLSNEFTSKNKVLYEPRDILLLADKSRIAVVISNPFGMSTVKSL